MLLSKEGASVLTQNTRSVAFNGQEIRTLSFEENFVYLCYHAAKHSFFRFCWLRDIAACLERWDLNQGRVSEIVNALGFERILGISLVLVDKYFKVPIPNEYDAFVKRRPWLTILQWMHRRIIFGPGKKKAKEVFKLKNLLKFSRRAEYQLVLSWFLMYLFLLFLKPGLKFKLDSIRKLYRLSRLNRKIRAQR